MSKKNITSASQFPNIFRFITEKKKIKSILNYDFSNLIASKKANNIYLGTIFVVCLFLVLLTFVFAVNLYKNTSQALEIVGQRQSLKNKILFWKSITDKYDGYKDAYFQIALIEYGLGNYREAKEANIKALLLDPNFESAKKLEKELEHKL